MLKSCKYCGKIHDSKYTCKEKPNKKKEITEADRFRWTSLWHRKREEIKKRDLYLCQIVTVFTHILSEEVPFRSIKITDWI